MKKTFITTLVLIAVLAAGLLLFLKSENFLSLIENFTSRQLNQPVRIGSIHLENGNRIVIRDLTVRDTEKDGPRIFFPRTEILLSPAGIKKRMIDELILTKPELLLTSWDKKKDAPVVDEISIPVDFQKVSIRDGAVIIRPGNKKDITMNELTLFLQRQEKEKTAKLKATARIPGFISKADVEATIDVRKINVREATLEFAGADLGALYRAASPEKTDTLVEGIADMNISIVNGKDDPGGRFGWSVKVSARDVFLHSEPVNVKPRDGSLRLQSNGTFRSKKSELEINVDFLGYMKIRLDDQVFWPSLPERIIKLKAVDSQFFCRLEFKLDSLLQGGVFQVIMNDGINLNESAQFTGDVARWRIIHRVTAILQLIALVAHDRRHVVGNYQLFICQWKLKFWTVLKAIPGSSCNGVLHIEADDNKGK